MSTSTVIRDSLKTVGRVAGPVGKAAIEAIFPAKCLACGQFIESSDSAPLDISSNDDIAHNWLYHVLSPVVCRCCMTGIQPVSSPLCECCGLVFTARAGQDHICETCIRAPNHFQLARSALLYSEQCASLVHALKYNGKIQLARPLGLILARTYDAFWSGEDVDLIIPVPLHRRRLKKRGFNQVRLMMREWARYREQASSPPAPAVFNRNTMERVLPTQPQAGLGRKDRSLNLRGAFGLKSGMDVAGLRILLVDDVYTTGATANEGARVLLKHGARRVDVLTLARAV